MVRLRQVTIRDVAAAAGVSVSTISKVVNERDGIAEGTREHVRAVIEDLGYVGSVGARALRSRRTGVIGVLVSQFEPYSAEVLKGVGHAAEGSDYDLMAWSGAARGPWAVSGWERTLLGRLAGSLIDGAIVITPSVTTPALGDFPLVLVDPHELEPARAAVSVEDAAGTCAAVEHLASLGHRRIGFLAGRSTLRSARRREAAFRRAVVDFGLDADPLLFAQGDYTGVGAIAPAHELLDLAERPTAVLAANDLSALRVLEVAASRGLSVPGDLSVVGFDEIPEATRSVPALTTVAQPMFEIGMTAMSMLLALLRGEQPDPLQVELPTHLVVRGSSAPPGPGR